MRTYDGLLASDSVRHARLVVAVSSTSAPEQSSQKSGPALADPSRTVSMACAVLRSGCLERLLNAPRTGRVCLGVGDCVPRDVRC